MWKILGVLLWGFTLHSNALESNSSILESKVFSYRHQQEGNVLTQSEYDYIVSVGSKLTAPGPKFLHYFFGHMITRRYGFTYAIWGLAQCNEFYPYYVNDKRGEFKLDDLKRVDKFINFKDFISDVPTNNHKEFAGFAVMELEKNVRVLATYVPRPTHEPDVNSMVGFNRIGGDYPTPDRVFVELGVVKIDKSECEIVFKSVDFCVKTTGDQIQVDDKDLGSLVYLDSRPVGINVAFYDGYGAIKLIPIDDYLKVEKRCEEKSASFAGTSASRA